MELVGIKKSENQVSTEATVNILAACKCATVFASRLQHQLKQQMEALKAPTISSDSQPSTNGNDNYSEASISRTL